MRGRGRERACGPAILSHRRGRCILSCLAVAVVVSSESVSKNLCFTSNKEMKRKKKKILQPKRHLSLGTVFLVVPSIFLRRDCPFLPGRHPPGFGLPRVVAVLSFPVVVVLFLALAVVYRCRRRS